MAATSTLCSSWVTGLPVITNVETRGTCSAAASGRAAPGLMVVRAERDRLERRPNEYAEKNVKGKPEYRTGKGFFAQLVEWTTRTSLKETDPILKKSMGIDSRGDKDNKMAKEGGLFGTGIGTPPTKKKTKGPFGLF